MYPFPAVDRQEQSCILLSLSRQTSEQRGIRGGLVCKKKGERLEKNLQTSYGLLGRVHHA